jgi:hypothetical protein
MPAEGLCVYLAQSDLQLALVEVDDVRVAVREQTLGTPLTADTTFLVAREDAMNAVSIWFVRMLGRSLTLEEWASRTS